MANRKIMITAVSVVTLGMAVLGTMNVAQAFDMGNMMNPGRWFDDDDDRYRGGYGRYGGYGPYGYGGGPYGWGGGPYGWGGGPYGWGGGPYGYGGYGGGYGRPSTIVVNPNSGEKAPPPKLPE
jgi:hypothetical protein